MWDTSTFCLLHAVSLCIYLHTHTEKQAVVSGYPGYQPAGSSCVSIYAHTGKQVVVSGYPGYRPAGSSFVYLYTRIQRNRLWYLGTKSINLLGLSVCIYIYVCRETVCGIWVPRVSARWVFLCIYIHAHRGAGSGIWVSRVSSCWVFLCVSIYAHIMEKLVVVSEYPGYQPAGSFCVYFNTCIQRNR